MFDVAVVGGVAEGFVVKGAIGVRGSEVSRVSFEPLMVGSSTLVAGEEKMKSISQGMERSGMRSMEEVDGMWGGTGD